MNAHKLMVMYLLYNNNITGKNYDSYLVKVVCVATFN